jgi:DNA-binding SARP family transcriptional activator
MDMLDFRVLGPVSVIRDGAEVALGGFKRRSLLALLLASGGRVVSTPSIVDALWEDEPPQSVVSSIQVSVSVLRAAFGERNHAGLLQTVPPGYRLVLAPGQSDLDRFRGECAAGRREEAAGRAATAAGHYRRALGEWSGRAFEDLAGLRFADELATQLEEERLATLDARIRADLGQGAHHDLVAELAGLVDAYPLRESFWRYLVLALYRCDRQADALAAYRRLRAHLLDELGVEPSAQVRQLERQILAQDPALDLPAAGTAGQAATERGDFGLAPAVLEFADGVRKPVPPTGLRIGRDVSNDVVIDDTMVSRKHAVVAPTAAGYAFVDLHSTNGSRIAGQLVVGEQMLAHGVEISIGSARLRFLMTQGAP